MSVLACDREGCPNILCDRHSGVYGYICNSCFSELIAAIDGGYPGSIDEFMHTPDKYKIESCRTNIESVFPLQKF